PEIFSFGFSADPRDSKLGERLKSSTYTSYALYAERTVGDQPGRPHARFITEWRNLPEGIFIDTNKFVNNSALLNTANDYARPFEYDTLPFPTINGNSFPVPHIAFDAQGRLVNAANQPSLQSEVIPLTRGSIWYAPGAFVDVREMPRGNSTSNWHRV